MNRAVESLLECVFSSADYDTLNYLIDLGSTSRMISKRDFDLFSIAPSSISSSKPEKRSTAVKHYTYIPIALNVLEPQAQVSLRGVYRRVNETESDYLKYSCTDVEDTRSVNLVLLSDGRPYLVDSKISVAYLDPIAVLQFSPIDPSLSRISGTPQPINIKYTDYIDFKLSGFCMRCKNLVFVPPIPEGVQSLENAFIDCTLLNCPIFLPSTIKNCTSMLSGCSNFASKIYLPSSLSIADVIGLDEYKQYVCSY